MVKLILIQGLFLGALASALAGVEIDPPEVPNPYNTSEARAIRDVLADSFKVKVSDKTSVEDLRALYRKTWNTDQENRYLDGREVDLRYAKAKHDEEAKVSRDRLREDLRKLGGTAPDDANEDALRKGIATRKAELEAQAQATAAEEHKRAADELSRQIENEQATTPRPSAAPIAENPLGPFSSLKFTPFGVTPVLSVKDGLSDEQILAQVKINLDQPTMSAVEHAQVLEKGKAIIQRRATLAKEHHGHRILVADPPIEIWESTDVDPGDPEKIIEQLWLINLTNRQIAAPEINVSFSGKTRNRTDNKGRHVDFVFPLGVTPLYVQTFYKDVGEEKSVTMSLGFVDQ